MIPTCRRWFLIHPFMSIICDIVKNKSTLLLNSSNIYWETPYVTDKIYN